MTDRPTKAQARIFAQIVLERERQRKLYSDGAFLFDCANPDVHHDKKLRVLAEEFGEVAEAIDRIENHRPTYSTEDIQKCFAEGMNHLREELTQVAAVATAWLESMEK